MIAKFVYESIQDLLKPKDLSVDQKLQWLFNHYHPERGWGQNSESIAQINSIKNLLKQDAKITFKMFSVVYETARWHWRLNHADPLLRIIEDLDEKYFKTEKDFRKTKEILEIDRVPTVNVTYPRGYKQYRLLKYIKDNYVTTRKELVKLLIELSSGEGTFNPIIHSGYYSTGWKNTYGKYYYKNDEGRLVLTREGEEKLNLLDDKFRKKNIKSTI